MTRTTPLLLPERSLLFQHLAAMEKAGVPPDRAYALLDLGERARAQVAQFCKLVARGIPPPVAGANSGLFTRFETRLLTAAFSAGSPLPAYQRLAAAHAASEHRRTRLRARFAMPVAVLVIALFVAPVPLLANGSLSGAGYLLKVLGPMLVLAAAAGAALWLRAWFRRGEPGAARTHIEQLLLSLPLFGPLHLRGQTRDFADSLALLLEAGMPLFDALPLATATVANGIVRADLERLLPRVVDGAPLSQAIFALRVVDTGVLYPLVNTGENSGTMAELLARFASAESEALERASDALADWMPRLFYALVAVWMIKQMFWPAR